MSLADTAGTPEKNRRAPDRFALTFTASSHGRGSDVRRRRKKIPKKTKKHTGPSVIYHLSSGLVYQPAESDWKEKKGVFVVPLAA